jgi:hypothetical protein
MISSRATTLTLTFSLQSRWKNAKIGFVTFAVLRPPLMVKIWSSAEWQDEKRINGSTMGSTSFYLVDGASSL